MKYYINKETKAEWRGGQHGVEIYDEAEGWKPSIFCSTKELAACHDVIEVDECGQVLRDVQP